jgi:hypothetical protein
MCKEPVKFGGEPKLRVFGDPFYPRRRGGRGGRSIKAAVYLDSIEVAGEIVQWIKPGAGFLWIDDTFPVFVRPACRSNAYLVVLG